MFDQPKAAQFTQGTIFSCAYAEQYPTAAVYGLVITARCDAAQDKAPIYSFVPVVSIKDWMLVDGAEIVLDRHIQDHQNTRKNILLALGLSDSLLKTKTTSEIVDGHLRKRAEEDRRLASKLTQFESCSFQIDEAKSALSGKAESEILTCLKKAPKHVDAVVKELAANRVLGHYLLRHMPRLYDNTGTDHVALLREIHHVPSAMARKIAQGMPMSGESGRTELQCPRFTAEDDYCTPVARLRSPWMEHLMQSLTLLFSRIGVEDIDAKSVKKSLSPLGLDT